MDFVRCVIIKFSWIRVIFIYWIAINLYIHLIGMKVRRFYLKGLLISTILSVLTFFLYLLFGPICKMLSLFIFLLTILCFFDGRTKKAFVLGIMAYGMGIALYSINAVLLLVVLSLTNQDFDGSTNSTMHVYIGISSIIMCECIFKKRRFARGIKFDNQNDKFLFPFLLGFMLFVSILIANFQVFGSDMDRYVYFGTFYILSIIIWVFWYKANTNYYRKHLREIEWDSYKKELEEKDMRIRQLEENNEAMAQIIHRDNKLIPAMIASTRSFLQCVDEEPEELAQRGAGLIAQLNEMAAGREGYLKSYESRRNEVVHTGHSGVDGVITYMYDRARERKVQCEVKVDRGFEEVIPDRISELDCAHLLADLMDNARIATENCDSRAISVHLGVISDFPVIEVSDSGAPFDPAVYQDFGLNKHSTHLGEGGSGIGLMDIWELKKKYRASLHIHEYVPGSGVFTKKLALVFDGKGHYLIQTYRYSELNAKKLRSDLHIISAQ